jgi:hypothetical protein
MTVAHIPAGSNRAQTIVVGGMDHGYAGNMVDGTCPDPACFRYCHDVL